MRQGRSVLSAPLHRVNFVFLRALQAEGCGLRFGNLVQRVAEPRSHAGERAPAGLRETAGAMRWLGDDDRHARSVNGRILLQAPKPDGKAKQFNP